MLREKWDLGFVFGSVVATGILSFLFDSGKDLRSFFIACVLHTTPALKERRPSRAMGVGLSGNRGPAVAGRFGVFELIIAQEIVSVTYEQLKVK